MDTIDGNFRSETLNPSDNCIKNLRSKILALWTEILAKKIEIFGSLNQKLLSKVSMLQLSASKVFNSRFPSISASKDPKLWFNSLKSLFFCSDLHLKGQNLWPKVSDAFIRWIQYFWFKVSIKIAFKKLSFWFKNLGYASKVGNSLQGCYRWPWLCLHV